MSSMTPEQLTEVFKSHDLIITTDGGEYRLSEFFCEDNGGALTYCADGAVFTIEFAFVENTSFVTRRLTARFDEKTQLLHIGAALPKADETVLYKTFYNASAAVFLRKGNIGYCLGFENPYVELCGDFYGFSPSLILGAGETYECDLNFFGGYAIFGEKISPCLGASGIARGGRYHPRYRNPSEGTPLYFSEIYEFNQYTDRYFGCEQKEFRFTSYNFFSNLPQRPQTEEQLRAYFEHIDNFVELGGDTILLNPLYPNEIPDADENSYWRLFPEGTDARRIFDYAKAKGLRVGIYMGTAGNGLYGNSTLIPYAGNTAWKKVGIDGAVSSENCIADDGFCDWFIKVQENTIREYGLSIWNWDPGPGNGFFCHCDTHGHLKGKGDYKGFRNSLRVMKTLKEEFPGLYIVGFHGNKEYGLWGFKYVDQHEAYWENEVYVMTPVFPDLSPDRATADGIRLQSAWNYYFRFMPATLNHGLAHRMLQACWMEMPDLDTLTDHTGWKFALLSAIAAGGSVTLPIIPRDPQRVDGYTVFYTKWINFARENFKYSKNTIPFGSQVACGGVDGFAKLLDSEGYIFLANPYPHPVEMQIVFDERIGYQRGKTAVLREIYPGSGRIAAVGYADTVTVTVSAYEVTVLSLFGAEADGAEAEDGNMTAPLPRVLTVRRENGGIVSSFYGDPRIKEILEDAQKCVTPDTVRVERQYCERFGRFNDGWTRPDRLWLWVIPEELTELPDFSLTVNGRRCECRREHYRHNDLDVPAVMFADITDHTCWGEENVIGITGVSGQVHLYLSYPKPEVEQPDVTPQPVGRQGTYAPTLDPAVKILDAIINKDNIVYQNTVNTLTASVNLPADEIEGVYASVPISIGDTGFECKCDMALDYSDGVWRKEFKSGSRIHLIIDDDEIVVWAVTKDGRESEGYEIPVNWLLNP